MDKRWQLPPWFRFVGIAFGALLAYHASFKDFFPNNQGFLGRDHAVFLPQLLDGTLWLNNNNFFNPPWFTPSFCGGLPAFANPGNVFYSVPQLLTMFLDPLKSVHGTFYLFAIIGFFGFYLLLNRSFGLSSPTSWLGATLFMFNGYYAHRMIIGQLTCHAFMLTPWVAWTLTSSKNTTKADDLFGKHFGAIAAAGLLLAYVVWSGALFLLLPMLMALMIIGLTHRLGCAAGANAFWFRLFAGFTLGMTLSAPKWWPGVQFLDHLGPAPTQLSNLKGLGEAFVLLTQSLFLSSPDLSTVAIASFPSSPPKDTGDFEFGITTVPLVLLIVGITMQIYRRRHENNRHIVPKDRLTLVLVIFIIAIIPLALSIHSPLWNPILRKAPIFREGVPMIHGWSTYVGVIILWSCLAYDRIKWTREQRTEQALVAIFLVLASNVWKDRDLYHQEKYDASPILLHYHTEKPPGWTGEINELVATIDPQTKLVTIPLQRNNVITFGQSMIFCNEPILGSGLQRFPFKPLVTGSVLRSTEAGFNMKNPACYLASHENQCKVGDHFQINQLDSLEKFSHYRPFPFNKPRGQETAERLSEIGLFSLLLGLVWTWARASKQAASSRQSHAAIV